MSIEEYAANYQEWVSGIAFTTYDFVVFSIRLLRLPQGMWAYTTAGVVSDLLRWLMGEELAFAIGEEVLRKRWAAEFRSEHLDECMRCMNDGCPRCGAGGGCVWWR